MDRIFENVAIVHKITVLDKNPVFVNACAVNKKVNKRRCVWDVDLGVTNCPVDVRNYITDNALKVLEFWKADVLPKLKATKPHRGRADSYLRAAIVSLARCCFRGGIQPGTKAETEFMGNITDEYLKTILCQKTAVSPRISDSSIFPTNTIELIDETLEAMFNTIRKHWSNAYKSYVSSLSMELPARYKKFGATIHFVDVWYEIIKCYADTPNHRERDLKLKNMMEVDRTCTTTPLYPLQTPSSIIVGDYTFKLLSEIILSPHIHPEWKIAMCKFVDKDINKMLVTSGVQADIGKAATLISELTEEGGEEEPAVAAEASSGRGLAPGEKFVIDSIRMNGKKYNPVQILPTATTFFDFCKGYNSPWETKQCMIFSEPSTHTDLASGAGLFGMFTGDAKDDDAEEVRATVKCITNLLGAEFCNSSSSNISTRRWREEGKVLSFNFCPLTFNGAAKGYGEDKARNVSAGFWVKSIQKAITDSIKRKRNTVDKGSRNSDLLSDEGCLRLPTVTFGCRDMLNELTGVSIFKESVSYQDPIQANYNGSDRLYAETRVVSHTFPSIR